MRIEKIKHSIQLNYTLRIKEDKSFSDNFSFDCTNSFISFETYISLIKNGRL